MQEFQGKVAVVTGAASGIGRALAERFAAEGMKVVLADVETEALAEVEAELRGRDAAVLAVPTDVAQGAQVEELARRTLDAFSAVHILCNNAGVAGGGGPIWEATEADWRWVLGVNLWGVIHGIRVFVPIMLAQEDEGHIVNTASVLGLTSGPGGGPYGVSKHAVVRITEGLHHDLMVRGAKLRASVLCPGMIATRITLSHRNRPPELQNPMDEETARRFAEQRRQAHARFTQFGMPPARVADIVIDAIRAEKFYILTHPNVKEGVRTRLEDILEERNPVPPRAPAGREP
jgi:NAD(P)-dependent dehydrogenase (short-subunit alcohol dehydrogenase family)